MGFTESVNWALRVMRFTIHTGLKVSPSELHHGRKPRSEYTNIVKDNKSYLSDWKTMNVSVPLKQIPNYVARNERREVTDCIKMTTKKKIACCSSHKSPKRKPTRPVSRNFQYNDFVSGGRRNQKKSLEGKYKEQPKIAIDGTEDTVRTTDNEVLHRKLMSTSLNFQRSQKKDVSLKKQTLRGPGGKYAIASEKAKNAADE